VKFLIDMPLSPELARWLEGEGHDAVHATDLGLASSSDQTILERAQGQGRVIVTADLDYPRLLALAKATGPGLILFRGGNYTQAEAEERLARALGAIPEQELPTSVVVIEKRRIRRRRLPVGLI
jgi:predicted nuclease of predicted toxin-antitoxin system